MTLAEMSAMGTTAGAPALQVSKGPPGGSGLPGSGPAAAMPGSAPPPPANPPMGQPARPVVGSHGGAVSVGTHGTASAAKGANPATHQF